MSKIQLANSGASYSGSAADLEALRDQFERQHYLKISQLLDLALLDFLQAQIRQAEFRERVHEGIGDNKEMCMESNTVSAALLFLVNDKNFFQVVQSLTGCQQIGCFEGRVYQVVGGGRHHDSWHSDIGEERLVGMSINLSQDVYSGGVLQIRDRESGEILSEVPNLGSGDAVIFRLSDRLQHRITDMESAVPKTAFAGWFQAKPDFNSLFRKRSEPRREVTLAAHSSPGFELNERSIREVIY